MNDDLISREWLEDAFDNFCCHNCKMCRNFRIEDSFYKCALIDNAPTILTITENTTNGDMIKSLFSSKIYQGGGLTNCLFQPNAFLEDRTSEWWNAPYKKETEND